jgi:hypothetical protein
VLLSSSDRHVLCSKIWEYLKVIKLTLAIPKEGKKMFLKHNVPLRYYDILTRSIPKYLCTGTISQ